MKSVFDIFNWVYIAEKALAFGIAFEDWPYKFEKTNCHWNKVGRILINWNCQYPIHINVKKEPFNIILKNYHSYQYWKMSFIDKKKSFKQILKQGPSNQY